MLKTPAPQGLELYDCTIAIGNQKTIMKLDANGHHDLH